MIHSARFRHLIRDAVRWGVALWLIGYILGIMPIGGLGTLWVLLMPLGVGRWRSSRLPRSPIAARGR